jgi:hypothetical protein
MRSNEPWPDLPRLELRHADGRSERLGRRQTLRVLIQSVVRDRAAFARACVLAFLVFVLCALAVAAATGGEHRVASIPGPHLPGGSDALPVTTAAERGYRILRTRPFIPPDFDQAVFDNLWKSWPEPLRTQAEQASPGQRREMAFSRYGLIHAPEGDDGRGPGLGYASDGNGGWVMSCLACHGGKVAGRVIPGLPNSHFALQTLTEEVCRTKLAMGQPLAHMELGALSIPLGLTNGTTNAVIFGILVGSRRGPDMEVIPRREMPPLLHHDMDAPPLWNVRKKQYLYCDGHAPVSHRVLMQFMLLPSNDAETVRGWEDEFEDILAWIRALEPPKYPWPIDEGLAARGERVFNRACSRCHGTHGPEGHYPEKNIPIDVVGTDPLRHHALTQVHREWLRQSWMTRDAEAPVLLHPPGYVAPPLDGIWASAPYFHNGSVPTLWHVLYPDERPAVWQRTQDGYDRQRVGLEVRTEIALPASVATPAEQRTWFDARLPGNSAAGHTFPAALSPEDKRALLEYLKTL